LVLMAFIVILIAGCTPIMDEGTTCLDEEVFDGLCDEAEETEDVVVDEVEETDESGLDYVAPKPATFKSKDEIREACDFTCGKGKNCWVKKDGTIACF